MAEGTDEQKTRHLPAILRGDEVWCQGFSEPAAGSDLAALRTRAVREGDDYVVTGHKIWCSFGQVGDFGELLVRTDPDAPKHRGISWLILPMDLTGIEVRPIETVLGSSEFSEVFLDEVRVPVANRVGAENDGWRVTQVTFSFERGTAFVSEMVEARRLLDDLAALTDDDADRRELGHLAAELDALWALTKRNVSRAARTGSPGDGALMIKLAYSETRTRLGELSLRVLGRAGLDLDAPEAGEMVEERLRTLSLTIAAGTSQIQRNIIGERLLGLPREPAVKL
jgi:alkylation response protein AidB-like acyl-CoA dehydrogenase